MFDFLLRIFLRAVNGYALDEEIGASQYFICFRASTCGAATCRVRDSKDDRALRKAELGHDAPSPWHGIALVARRRQIASRRYPTYVMLSRATLPVHTPR